MLRGLAFAMLLMALPSAAVVQGSGVLHIRIVLKGTGEVSTPIRRHALLISDNPASAAPRLVHTSQDGTVDVRLRAGNYTVESDRPIAFEGKAYQWRQNVDIVSGRDAVLELTGDNAEVESVSADTAALSPLEEDASSLATRWQDSVVGVWTPTAHASGFVIDASGLVVTNQTGIGTASSVEVQFSPTLKVPATVVATDPARDVAVVRIDPATAAAVKPVPLGCGEALPAPAEGDRIFAIEAPLRVQKGTASGRVRRVTGQIIESDILPSTGGSGGPVFNVQGTALGMTSEGTDRQSQSSDDPRVVRTSEVCAVVELARTKVTGVAPPGTPLPIEPARPYPTKALEGVVASRAGSLNPYQTSSANFDIAFLTPVHVHAGQRRSGASSQRSGPPDATWLQARLVTDFSNWSDYVADVPPVLMIRVTPKLVESFWTKVARGAAYTQGVALPPMKRLKSGFSRMRVFCGDAEITPIHPFVLEQEVSETATLTEGLYVFDPGALPPTCPNVRLSLYSQQDPTKADTRAIEAKVIQQVWDDFAPYRAQP
jgi:S1-C subfamily serine protease